MTNESDRRKEVIAKGQTDFARWRDPAQLEQAWDRRAGIAADLIPAAAAVLDLGCGRMALEKVLPPACVYIPCDLVARDQRTVICNFNNGEFPNAANVSHVAVLGVLEYLYDVRGFLQKLRACGRPVLLSYSPMDFTGDLDRPALGWVNHLTAAELEGALAEAGLAVTVRLKIDERQLLLRLSPERLPKLPNCRVLVVSAHHVGNFGDRLGYHLINEVLPAHTTIHHATINFGGGCTIENVPEGNFDLVVVGCGNSIYGKMINESMLGVLKRARNAIGIFGTQYREKTDPRHVGALLDRLHTWYARFEEDILWYGKGRGNVVHLGDWLVSAFPMAKGENSETLTIGDEMWNELPLDRTIQNIQSYRYVYSTRMHPLLCAFTSAEQAAYQEQREVNIVLTSGKFRSLLIDVFGRTFPPNEFFMIDRDAVIAYKVKVQRAMADMRKALADLCRG